MKRPSPARPRNRRFCAADTRGGTARLLSPHRSRADPEKAPAPCRLGCCRTVSRFNFLIGPPPCAISLRTMAIKIRRQTQDRRNLKNAGGGTRTHTYLRITDFESVVSAISPHRLRHENGRYYARLHGGGQGKVGFAGDQCLRDHQAGTGIKPVPADMISTQ